MKTILADFDSIYREPDIGQKKRFNHLIFSEIWSHYMTGDNGGIVEIKSHGDGSQIKNDQKSKMRTVDQLTARMISLAPRMPPNFELFST